MRFLSRFGFWVFRGKESAPKRKIFQIRDKFLTQKIISMKHNDELYMFFAEIRDKRVNFLVYINDKQNAKYQF